MSAVIDASVAVAAVADSGAAGDWAGQVIAAGALVAPQLMLVEATNILRRLERARRLARSESTAAQRDLLSLDVDLAPFHPFAARVWALRHDLTSYDAWYVAVAEELSLPLATLDGRLVRANGPTCRFLVPA